jgi:restriction system protein
VVGLAVLRRLDSRLYRVFHDLYLPRPDGKGTTQIDHVVVSRYGIFVIETKNMTGWIFGDANSGVTAAQCNNHKKTFDL